MVPPVKKRKKECVGLDDRSEEEGKASLILAKTTTSSSDQTNKNEQDESSDKGAPYPFRPPVVFEARSSRKRKNGDVQMSRHDIKWNEMFNRLVQYKAEQGDCIVPQSYQADERLGRWVHYQRVEFWLLKQRGSGKITSSRIDKLDSIGFEWDPQKSKWNNMFHRLVDFKSGHGHCMVPKGHKEDKELANWVRNQRLEHQNLERNKKSHMTKERKENLDSIGFQWNAR